jgi:hypothetical protein
MSPDRKLDPVHRFARRSVPVNHRVDPSWYDCHHVGCTCAVPAMVNSNRIHQTTGVGEVRGQLPTEAAGAEPEADVSGHRIAHHSGAEEDIGDVGCIIAAAAKPAICDGRSRIQAAIADPVGMNRNNQPAPIGRLSGQVRCVGS